MTTPRPHRSYTTSGPPVPASVFRRRRGLADRRGRPRIHSDVGKYMHNRWEELMSDVQARRFTESRRFADELRRDDRQAVLVIANEVKA